jgi:hypothetical protein
MTFEQARCLCDYKDLRRRSVMLNIQKQKFSLVNVQSTKTQSLKMHLPFWNIGLISYQMRLN